MTPDLAQALTALPHGSEFRFLDRLVELEPGQRGVGEYTLRGDESFCRGHFPGQPLMPGVLLIEAAAQLAGVVAQSDPTRPPLPELKLTAVQQAKITGTARPGQTMTVQAEVVGRLSHLVQVRAGVSVEGREILRVELTLSGARGEP